MWGARGDSSPGYRCAHPGYDRAGLLAAVLYAVYGSDIVVRLMRIQAHPGRDRPDGFLVIALYGRTPAYVQCVFLDNGETLLCEVLLGRYPPKPGAPPHSINRETEAALKETGYWRDRASGRALLKYELGQEPDSGILGAAAASILGPLIDVFGANPGSKIEIVAPLAPEWDEAAIRRVVRASRRETSVET